MNYTTPFVFESAFIKDRPSSRGAAICKKLGTIWCLLYILQRKTTHWLHRRQLAGEWKRGEKRYECLCVCGGGDWVGWIWLRSRIGD